MKRQEITVNNDAEKASLQKLESQNDVKSERIKRLLALPDLTKKEGISTASTPKILSKNHLRRMLIETCKVVSIYVISA